MSYAASFEPLPPGTDRRVVHAAFRDTGAAVTLDPVGWIQRSTREHLWSKQVEIAESVARHRYTAVQACHGVGKSWLMARLIAWWTMIHPPGTSLVLFTAPTWRQVNTIIGKELRSTINRCNLPGRLNKNGEWWIGDHLVALGLKPADNSDSAFQGQHAEHILVVVDEADGVHENIWTGVDSVATSHDARVIAIGNPMTPGSRFHKVCGHGDNPKDERWDNVIRVSVWDSPGFSGERVPARLLRVLVTPAWVQERRRRWGRGSILWEGRVEGRFPKTSSDLLIAPELISRALRREVSGHELGRFGVDVARFGDSLTTIYRYRGGAIRLMEASNHTSGPEVYRMVKRWSDAAHRQAAINVDGDGVGGPVFDMLAEDEQPVFEFRGGFAAQDPSRFLNARSEAYWNLRQLFVDDAIDLEVNEDGEAADEALVAQLSNLRWKLKGGRIAVETKEEMRKRGVPSPDHADGAMMSTWPLGDSPYQLDVAMRQHELETRGIREEVGNVTAGMLDERY